MEALLEFSKGPLFRLCFGIMVLGLIRILFLNIWGIFKAYRKAGDKNICCGGGGGTVSIDEIRPYRTTVGGKLKADQIRKSGCTILVAPCANCKKQLRELVEDQKIDCLVVGLHDLIYKAIIFDESLIVEKNSKSNLVSKEK